jgi:hypothetical protein
LKPSVQSADASLRPTRAEVLLDAIGHNLKVVQNAAQGHKVLAVVKADAYGHGVVPVAQRLQAEGVDGFGVALAEEGIELREAGIDRAILVLNGISGGAHRDIIAAGLTPVLYEISEASAFDAISDGRPIDVHLKVDTGMGRLGVPLGELTNFLRELRRFPSIRIAGLMTHLSTADTDPAWVSFAASVTSRPSCMSPTVRRCSVTPKPISIGCVPVSRFMVILVPIPSTHRFGRRCAGAPKFSGCGRSSRESLLATGVPFVRRRRRWWRPSRLGMAMGCYARRRTAGTC